MNCAGSTPIPRCTLAAHWTFSIAASLPTVYTTCGRNSSPIPFYSTYLTNHVTQLFEVKVKEFDAHLRGKLPINLAQGDLHHSVCIMQLHKVGPGLPHFFAPQLLWSINFPILGLECWSALSRFNLLCNFGRLFCYFMITVFCRQDCVVLKWMVFRHVVLIPTYITLLLVPSKSSCLM